MFLHAYMQSFCLVTWLRHSPKLSVLTALTSACLFFLALTAFAVVLARFLPFLADFLAEIEISSTSLCSANFSTLARVRCVSL